MRFDINEQLEQPEQPEQPEQEEGIVFGKWFCGNIISDEGLKYGFVDYATLAKSFNHVRNNTVISAVDDWELVNGSDYNPDEDEYAEVFQYFIIDENGYNILSDYTDEIVYYSDSLNMYLWGITHYGTSWNYVLTDIKCMKEGEQG